VPVINISGIKPGQLKLTGPLLAQIYLGRIKKWNDAAIGALNPRLALPNTNITVVYRSDLSGTSLLWTDYLSRSSPDWQSNVGVSLTPRWPTGVSGASHPPRAGTQPKYCGFSIGHYIRESRWRGNWTTLRCRVQSSVSSRLSRRVARQLRKAFMARGSLSQTCHR
jgi:hypothetical protein